MVEQIIEDKNLEKEIKSYKEFLSFLQEDIEDYPLLNDSIDFDDYSK